MKGLMTFFLIIFSVIPFILAVKDKTKENSSRTAASSSGIGHSGTTFIDKHYGKGAKGTIVQVPLPERDAILKRTKNKRPANYETLEQKVARTSKHYIRTGKFTDHEEAVRAAKEYHRMRGQMSNVWRKEKGKRTKKNPPGYGTKKEWLSRRVESLIAETGNGIDDHVHAEEVAKEQYAERLKRKNEAKRKTRQMGNLGQQPNNQLKVDADGSEYIPSESESGSEASKPKSPINRHMTLDQNIPKKPRTINFATRYVEKFTRYGPRGQTMKVALPKEDEIMRTKKKKKPFGYSRLEQKVARTANHYFRTGKYENHDDSVLAAQKYHRDKNNLYSQSRIRKPGGKKKPRGYNKKDNWISRRVVTHLVVDGNGVSNHEEAREKAEADWEEKKRKNRESTRFYRRLRKNGGR